MLDPNNKAARDIFANKVVEAMAGGYQEGVDAAQAQADAKMKEFSAKEGLKQQYRLESKEQTANQQLQKIILQNQLKKKTTPSALKCKSKEKRIKIKPLSYIKTTKNHHLFLASNYTML